MGISEKEMAKLKYRFEGDRYSLRGPAHWGPSDIILEIPGAYAYPKPDSYPSITPAMLVLLRKSPR